MNSPQIALVYDRINKFGGAERVLLALHELFPDAPLFTALYHPAKAAWAKDFDIRPSFLNTLPFLRDKHEYLAPLMPYAFESFDFSAFDIVISVTSAEAKGIITGPQTLHLCYLLTPTRYLWSHTQAYAGNGLKKALLLPFLSRLRRWDYLAAHRPDHLIAISESVASRTRKYYRRDPLTVIYPPVNLPKEVSTTTPRTGPFLIVSRLVRYKSLDYVLEAFRRLPQEKLNIVGIGHDYARLKSLAPPNVHFLGSVSESRLHKLYQSASALIFPQEEDFGISLVEALSYGTPAIAYGSGGATEIMAPGVTGVLFQAQTAASLQTALNQFRSQNWYDSRIRALAHRFDKKRFMRQCKSTVESLWEKHLRT